MPFEATQHADVSHAPRAAAGQDERERGAGRDVLPFRVEQGSSDLALLLAFDLAEGCADQKALLHQNAFSSATTLAFDKPRGSIVEAIEPSRRRGGAQRP